MLETNIADWHLFLSVANVPVVGVNPNTPYKTMKELLDAMKAKPGQITVATAGVTSGGHNAMEAIARATGVKYRHVTYDGGNPAVVATVAGETEVTTQLAVEQAEMIRGKRLRPLAAVGDKPLELEGYGTIEPITHSRRRHARCRPTTSASSSRRACRRRSSPRVEKIWADHIAKLGGAEEVRHQPRRAVRAAVGRRTRRRRRCRRSRPTPGCCTTAARPRSRPTRVGIPKP